jgi:putative ABC transport system permease protein
MSRPTRPRGPGGPRLALARLILVDSRGAWVRLVGVTAGVAVGVTLFLLLFGAYGALSDRQERSTWVSMSTGEYLADSSPAGSTAAGPDAGGSPDDDSVFALLSQDRHAGDIITRLDIAATPNSTVRIPGLSAAPALGEFHASPALVRLIESTPAAQLGDRYGALAGTLPDSVLASPDSLVAVVGADAQTILASPAGLRTSEFTANPYGGNQNYLFVTIIGGIAVLLPVLLLVAIVTKLGAAERRERFATLRLIGATPGTVTRLAALETAVVSLVGGLLGVVLAVLFRPVAALVSIDEGTFFVADLRVDPLSTAIVVAATTVGATLAAAWSIRRADIGPLGSTRQQHESRPRALRLLPLAVGILVITLTNVGSQLGILPIDSGLPLIGGFLVTSIGLIVAGPYLVWRATGLLSRRVTSAAGLVAVNRVRRAPAATFRSVSGLVIALFMVSVFAGAASTAELESTIADSPGLLPVTSLSASIDPSQPSDPARLETVVQTLESTEGVTGVTVSYGLDSEAMLEDGAVEYGAVEYGHSVVSAAAASALGFTTVPSAPFVSFDTYAFLATAGPPVELRPVAVDDLTGLTPLSLYVHTLGTRAAIEGARTALETSGLILPGDTPGTRADYSGVNQRSLLNSYATLAYLGVGVATLVSAVSLAVATTAAMLDRKRVLGLLRLMGMRVGTLRRIIGYETAAPLLVILALCIGLGFLTAYLILTGLTGGARTIGVPDERYFIALAASVLLAVLAVVSTFGSIRRNTAISSTRFE